MSYLGPKQAQDRVRAFKKAFTAILREHDSRWKKEFKRSDGDALTDATTYDGAGVRDAFFHLLETAKAIDLLREEVSRAHVKSAARAVACKPKARPKKKAKR